MSHPSSLLLRPHFSPKLRLVGGCFFPNLIQGRGRARGVDAEPFKHSPRLAARQLAGLVLLVVLVCGARPQRTHTSPDARPAARCCGDCGGLVRGFWRRLGWVAEPARIWW